MFRLAFRYDPEILSKVKALPYAAFDGQTKTWTAQVCAQSLDALRAMRWDGLLDVDPDDLLEPGENPAPVREATLTSGSVRRPFLVRTAVRDDGLYRRLVAIPGARWEKAASAVSYPPTAAAALAELVDRGVVDDPHRLLQPADVVVTFDARVGRFHVRGDQRAAAAFEKNFPGTDVMAVWAERGLDVAFADSFSEEMYRGEIARRGEGIQPAGMTLELYPYQRVDVAVALERSGIGIFSGMGVGKCLRGDQRVRVNGELLRLDEIWERYAGTTRLRDEDGGEWAGANAVLEVVSVDADDRFCTGAVTQLYRQKVAEPLREVLLADGRCVVTTMAHRFLERRRGWVNDITTGDTIAASRTGTDAHGGDPVEWVTVEAVMDVPHAGWVYDLAVEGHHNFLAEGVVCHNTILGIAIGHELMANRQAVPRVIVVVPPAVRTQWHDEIIRFTGASPDDVVVVDGDKKKRLAAYDRMDAGAKWLVVHYQAIILPDDRKRLEALAAGALVIADEAHRLKNQEAKTTKVAQSLAKKAARRVALTGTPVENNPGEWFNVLSGFAVPGVFGSPMEFLNRYCYPGKFGGFEGARNVPELRERSRPLYVRRTLNDVAEHLPKLRVQTIALDPKPEYASALKRAHREAREEIKRKRLETVEKRQNVLDGYDREEIETGADMTAVGMLKLLCCSPRIVAESDSPAAEALREGGLIPDDDGPKLDELRVMCAEMQANGDRIVVFTASKRMANLIGARLGEDGIRHVMFTGDTNKDARDAAVRAFITPATDEDPGPTVFVSTDAGAEGLNLGRCCSTLVNVDIPWTPGRLGQRNARVRRVDSTASSFLIVNLVVRGTLEEGILRMVEHKADLADAILGESGGRRGTTGRGGRNIFEAALEDWNG